MSERRKVLELFERYKAEISDRINSGIEANRKGWARIVVKTEDGKPIKNAKIKVTQKTHQFKYGANIFMLDEFESADKNKLYKKYFKECFNMATLPFYWDALEPDKGELRYAKDCSKIYRRPSTDLCVEFCKENGIEPREHGLAYEHNFPRWLANKSVQEVKKEFIRRCKEISERYADRIPCIEVTNETEHRNGVTALFDEPDFVEWCFKTARKYFPYNILSINEHQNSTWTAPGRTCDRYYLQIENNLAKGAEIDAIGMQFHMFFKPEEEYSNTRMYYDPMHLYKILDLYGRFDKDIQITEITIPCYTENEEDEEIQSELIELLYSIWFSHKNVSQIVYWNLVDGYCHVNDPKQIKNSQGNMTLGENFFRGGLLRFDFTPKPSYFKIKELFQKKWHTEIEVNTNDDGEAVFKGFYGDYDVIVETEDNKIQTHQISFNKGINPFFEIII